MLSYLKKILQGTEPASGLAPRYYADDIERRDLLIAEILEKMSTGTGWLDAIRTPRAASHGERVAEYAYIAALLAELDPLSLMDVGCVLNNRVIAGRVGEQRRLHFLNPGLEAVVYPEYCYFRYPLSKWREEWTFPLVTCLSTIEHIGFDNTRYGVAEVDQGWDWPRCIEEIVRSVRTLHAMTAPGGTTVVSCPFGVAEFVLHPPVTGVRTAQNLHAGHLPALREAFGSSLEITILRLSAEGWLPAKADASFAPYGAIGPGASGLLFLTLEKAHD